MNNKFPAEFSKTAMNQSFSKLCECVVTCSKLRGQPQTNS